MSVNINSVVLIGRLTKDPDVGERRCMLRLAVNERRRVKGTDETPDAWVDRPNYFDIVTFGALAQTCGRNLVRGRLVGVTGSLAFHEWPGEDENAPKRRKVEVIADQVSFLDAPRVAAGADPQPQPQPEPEPDPVAAPAAA